MRNEKGRTAVRPYFYPRAGSQRLAKVVGPYRSLEKVNAKNEMLK